MKGLTMNELNIGDKDSFEKTVSESDVYLYAGITGDLNPAHINEREAQTTMFKGRIAHGMLTAGFISAVLGINCQDQELYIWVKSLNLQLQLDSEIQ